ncbi:MAG TPA: hypothetical protein VGO62_13755 [Myxococcota bacterium]|jgi:hypothetical protein
MRIALLCLALVISLPLVAALSACPAPSAGEGEGEGEGGGGGDPDAVVCTPPCTGATACAVDNCGGKTCQAVANAGDSCSVASATCIAGGALACAAGSECAGVGGAALTCTAPGADGAACDGSTQDASRDACGEGFACLASAGTCGRACSNLVQCAGSDECVAGVCVAQALEGEPCPTEATVNVDDASDGCQAGLRCGFDANNNGPQCIHDECASNDDCPGQVCYFPGCGLQVRRCADAVGEGEPCFAGCASDSATGDCSNFAQACADGLECEHFLQSDQCADGGSTGTCVVPGGAGSSCSVTGNKATDGCDNDHACDQTALSCL